MAKRQRQVLALAADSQQFIEKSLTILDKQGALVPLKLNPVQKRLIDEIDRCKKQGVPCRIIVLKARQLGISTACAAAFYQRTVTARGVNSMIVAHKADASTAIFNKCKLFYELSPAALKPLLRASNAKELLFENPARGAKAAPKPGLRSKIAIETAQNRDAGRSLTIHNLHLSELAFWPFARETLTSLLNAVPYLPTTCCIVESTACGVGGAFYDLWQGAVAGENGFTPLFFPWYLDSSYALEAGGDFCPTAEEEQLKRDYGLSDAQLNWRRRCIELNCQGDVQLFKQEYPIEPQEAFIASGRPVFDCEALAGALRGAVDAPRRGRLVDEDGHLSFCPEPNGELSLWQEPLGGRDYAIGVDSALGVAYGDFAAIEVVDAETLLQVAEWHGHIDPDLLGGVAACLGRWYNNALIVPEANNHGAAVIAALKNACYPRIYRRRELGKSFDRTLADYGFYTSAASKPLLLAALASHIRGGAQGIKSRRCLLECLDYQYDASGAAAAASGHDDCVMALALAVYAVSGRGGQSGVYLPYYPMTDRTGY